MRHHSSLFQVATGSRKDMRVEFDDALRPAYVLLIHPAVCQRGTAYAYEPHPKNYHSSPSEQLSADSAATNNYPAYSIKGKEPQLITRTLVVTTSVNNNVLVFKTSGCYSSGYTIHSPFTNSQVVHTDFTATSL